MKQLTVVITKRVRETPSVVTQYFTLKDGSVLPYTAGQYITVYFDGSSTPEGKAYSLSSAPYEKVMSITVKVIGEFSRKIAALRVGDKLCISEAYGFFGPNTAQPLVCCAGGVGISPLWSIIKDVYRQNPQRDVRLYYSNKTLGSIAFSSQLSEHALNYPRLQLVHHVTRQRVVPQHVVPHRIDFARCGSNLQQPFFLVCGSDDFVCTAWRQFSASGIAPENISTETFFTL